jgi:hypothetical protein
MFCNKQAIYSPSTEELRQRVDNQKEGKITHTHAAGTTAKQQD